jgi:hypothetical protein
MPSGWATIRATTLPMRSTPNFGTGTQLQEMYITPTLLSEKDWNVLAQTAKWSRANAEVL